MDYDALNEILRKHELWLGGDDGGEHADLRSADLRSADLSSADLSYANLSYAIGLRLLPVQDYQGYSWPHAILSEGDEWKIVAGCRFFTIGQAREHWGDSYIGDRELGDMYLHAIDWLEAKLSGVT